MVYASGRRPLVIGSVPRKCVRGVRSRYTCDTRDRVGDRAIARSHEHDIAHGDSPAQVIRLLADLSRLVHRAGGILGQRRRLKQTCAQRNRKVPSSCLYQRCGLSPIWRGGPLCDPTSLAPARESRFRYDVRRRTPPSPPKHHPACQASRSRSGRWAASGTDRQCSLVAARERAWASGAATVLHQDVRSRRLPGGSSSGGRDNDRLGTHVTRYPAIPCGITRAMMSYRL